MPDDGTVLYNTNGNNPEMVDNVQETKNRIKEFMQSSPVGPLEVLNIWQHLK